MAPDTTFLFHVDCSITMDLFPNPPIADLQYSPLTVSTENRNKANRGLWSNKRKIAASLAGKTTVAIMQKLSEGDPLEIRKHIRHRLAYQAILLDPARLRWRALTLCALSLNKHGLRGSLEDLLDPTIDAAIRSLIGDDWLANNMGRLGSPARCSSRAVETNEFLPPERARRIALEFNLQDHLQRQLLYSILVEGTAPNEAAHAFGIQPDELADRLNRLLDRVGQHDSLEA